MRLPHTMFMHGLLLYRLPPRLNFHYHPPHFSTIRPVNLAFHSGALQLAERILSGIGFLMKWRPA
jgi:hypothetical protein